VLYLDLTKIPPILLEQFVGFLKDDDYDGNQAVWQQFTRFFKQGPGKALLQCLAGRERSMLYTHYFRKLEAVRLIQILRHLNCF
jgi:hypothetical protein